MKAMRPRWAVGERLEAAGSEAGHPFPDGLEANPEGDGDDARRLSFKDHPAFDLGSTMRGGAGIAMNVHPVSDPKS